MTDGIHVWYDVNNDRWVSKKAKQGEVLDPDKAAAWPPQLGSRPHDQLPEWTPLTDSAQPQEPETEATTTPG